MFPQRLFPPYIRRGEPEQQIRQAILEVQRQRQSRALLLYGVGGVGKSYLLRHLKDTPDIQNIHILGPYDVDDLEFWSLTNLQKRLSEGIPGGFFDDYIAYISQLPRFERPTVGRETALAYLRKGDDVFERCYRQYVETSKSAPIIILDTIEAIRGADTLKKILVWIKRLHPGALFILSGRPPEGGIDPIAQELDEAPVLPYLRVELKEFTRQESLAYFQNSAVAAGLTAEDQDRLVLLCQGHPLWLSLAVYYTATLGLPEEIKKLTFNVAEQPWPYQNGPLHDAFIRRLVVPYREPGFWHEAVLRLGVVRQRLDKELWIALMQDQSLPGEAGSWDEAWEQFLRLPWVRPRANWQYVTLQDALAEELAKRILPHQDYERSWRKGLWQKSIENYTRAITEQEVELEARRQKLDEAFGKAQPGERRSDLLSDVLAVENRSMELFLLQTARLYYQMLVDYQAGSQGFIDLFNRAAVDHQYRFIELLWSEMQCFLPGEQTSYASEEIARPEVLIFQEWYQSDPSIQFEIIHRIAKYLYDIGQATDSDRRLSQLWEVCQGNLIWEYRILNLRANARMRIPGRAREAETDFLQALEWARREDAPAELKSREGEALKELGYYYRNVGKWSNAASSYLEALRITPLGNHKEKAAIQSQYAYVVALRGLYQEARDMVESALEVRRKLNLLDQIGMALSVKGEVNRYAREYETAWEAYREAETIFESLDNWSWLGLVQQEMAICLYQAQRAGKLLVGFDSLEAMLEQGRVLILNALDYCREYSRRAYPSALNRAGRIIGWGFEKFDQGLDYLEEGIHEAETLVDGWFWFANLIEYVELSYRTWQITKDKSYLTAIENKAEAIETVKKEEYEFPDLQGRWEVLQGQLKADEAHDATDNVEREKSYNEALEHFKQGYPLIGLGYIGSHGAAALADEFKWLEKVMVELPVEVRGEWFNRLNNAWCKTTSDIITKERQEGSLLARLTELHMKVMPINEEG